TQSRIQQSIAALWVTNTERSRSAVYDVLRAAGLGDFEEWIWAKTTTRGELVSPLEGLWRKPYEILIVGQKKALIEPENTGHASIADGVIGTTKEVKMRRLIAAVPDVHSRKPNLKEVFEAVFFSPFSPPPFPLHPSDSGIR